MCIILEALSWIFCSSYCSNCIQKITHLGLGVKPKISWGGGKREPPRVSFIGSRPSNLGKQHNHTRPWKTLSTESNGPHVMTFSLWYFKPLCCNFMPDSPNLSRSSNLVNCKNLLYIVVLGDILLETCCIPNCSTGTFNWNILFPRVKIHE